VSSPLAIGAVTAALRRLLEKIALPLIPSSITGTTVSVIAPALIRPETETRLNLFLFHVTENAAWRNSALPSHAPDARRLTNAPLALDLHYLLTAYAPGDYAAEVLLGAGMHAFHETPVLSRDYLLEIFTKPDATGALPTGTFKDVGASELAEQVELIKITPETMTPEEMSKLWSALMTGYRPTVAYHVSVILIERQAPLKAPLPVLRRGPLDEGVVVRPNLLSPFPALTEIELPAGQTDVRLGERINLIGHDLAGDTIRVFFDTSPVDRLEGTVISADDRKIVVELPNAPAAWPAGPYAVSALVRRATKPDRTTNALPLLVAPGIGSIDVAPAGTTATRLTVTATQNVWPKQRAAFVAGERQAPAEARTAETDTLVFLFAPPLTAGDYIVRLRVDGVDSRVIDRSVTPPRFDPTQVLTISP
jgi:hypothetical protein